MVTTVEDAFRLMEERGGASYLGEPVTQLDHALQTAALADAAGASPSLVIAALLHDIGHLLDFPDAGPGVPHEIAGAECLRRIFGDAVAVPVQLHVDAKRFLCASIPDYMRRLSAASVESLRVQGGPLSPEECKAFIRLPYASQAIRLRYWDECAKLSGESGAGLAAYRQRAMQVCRLR